MEGLFVLILVLLVICFILLPVIILVKIVSIGSRLSEQEVIIRKLEGHIDKLNTLLHKQKVEPSGEIQEEVLPSVNDLKPGEDADDKYKTVPVEVDDVIALHVADPDPEPVCIPFEEISQETENMPSYIPEECTLPPETAVPVEPVRRKNIFSAEIRFENLLSKIGIVTLVLGVAFFVKYAIDKDWINETGRVAIGILTGGVLIVVAHKLRTKYERFSAILVGGGISVFYITITLAFREYHLFPQSVAFVILILITLFSVLLSLLYDRKELALFSLLGGFASPLMISTGEGNYIVLFSFLFILNSGMLIISMRKQWRIIGVVSFICTLSFYWVWLVSRFEQQQAGALCFAALFFIQFYLLALADHFRSTRKISPYQVWIILTNNLSMFAASIHIFNDSTLKIKGVVTVAMAVVNAIVLLTLYRKMSIDKRLIYLIIAIILSFVSLAVPMQVDGHVITMFWAVESVILLWLWSKSEIRIFHIGFLIISILTLISYLMDIRINYFIGHEPLLIVFNRICITGVVMLVAFAADRFLLDKIDTPSNGMFSTGVLRRIFTVVLIAMAYIVPLSEIYYQFNTSAVEGLYKFVTMMAGAFTTIYVAALATVYKKRLPHTPWMLYALIVYVVGYLILVMLPIIDLRWEVFYLGIHQTLFLTHYIPLLALAYIYYILVMHIKTLPGRQFVYVGWLLVICGVLVLSVELDTTMTQCFANTENYHDLLYDVRTFGYPILWSVLAMVLMIWGLKVKEVLLRRISLAFFAVIILKFYFNDIWLMSQTGRIISFVALGVILLLVSFMVQKIKGLITIDKDEHQEPDEQKQH